MREENIYFESNGIKLSGVLHLPDKRAPGIILCHGAGGHKEYHKWEANPLVEVGFAVLRFDFRGCGLSGGTRGLIKPSDEIRDLKNAITYLQSRSEVDEENIGVCGHSLGGAVVIAVSSEDRRVKAAISISAPSSLARAPEELVLPEDRERILSMLSIDKVKRAYDKPTKISLDQIPQREREIPKTDLEAAEFLLHDPLIVREFLAESLEDMMTFRPIDMVDKISPRPILFIHGEEDAAVEAYHAQELYNRAKEPKELRIIKSAGHSVPVDEINPLIISWFRKYL